MPTKKKRIARATQNPERAARAVTDGLMTADAIEDASAALKKALIERALSVNLVTTWAIRRARSARRIKSLNAMAKAVRLF